MESGFLPYSVSVVQDGRQRTIGEYRRFEVARMVARLALTSKTTLAVVRHIDRGMVFAIDHSTQWEEVMP